MVSSDLPNVFTLALRIKPMNRVEWRGTFYVALSGMLYGLIGYLGTMLFQENLSVSTMLFWRFLVAGVWIFLSSSAKKIQRVRDPALIRTILLAIISYSLG